MRPELRDSLISLYKKLDAGQGRLPEESLPDLLEDYNELSEILRGAEIDWKAFGINNEADQDGIDRLLDYAENYIAKVGNELGASLMMLSVKYARTGELSGDELAQLLIAYNKFAPLVETESGFLRSKKALSWELLGIRPEVSGEASEKLGKLLNYLNFQGGRLPDPGALKDLCDDLTRLGGPEFERLRSQPLPNSEPKSQSARAFSSSSSQEKESVILAQPTRNWNRAIEILLGCLAVVVGGALVAAHLMLAGSVVLAVAVGAVAALTVLSFKRDTKTEATVAPLPEFLSELSAGLGVSVHGSLNAPAPAAPAKQASAGLSGDGDDDSDVDNSSLHP